MKPGAPPSTRASRRRSQARAPRPGPAGRGHGAAGPVLCVAPAGSGKTTTLVARVAWLIDGGTPAGADRARSPSTSAPPRSWPSGWMRRWSRSASRPGSVRVRTFHALGREILRDAGAAGRAARRSRRDPSPSPPGRRRRRTGAARHRVLAVEAGPGRHGRRGRGRPRRRADRAGVRGVRARPRRDRRPRLRRPRPAGARRARRRDASLVARWRARCRTCSSTRSRTSTGRSSGSPCCSPRRPIGSSSSATTTSRSTAGGSPTSVACSIWPQSLPGLRRVDLEVNHRCPAPVVERAVRLVDHNRERFAKVIRPGPTRTGSARARAGSARRAGRASGACSVVAGRRIDPGRPRADQPRAAAGRRPGRDRARPAVPGAAVELLVESRSRRCCWNASLPRRRPGPPLLVAARPAPVRSLHAGRGSQRAALRRLLGWAPRYRDVHGLRPPSRDARPARRAAPRRREAEPCHRPCHQGPRVRSRRRHRDGGGPLPERTSRRRTPTTRGGPRGRTPAGVRRVDPRPADADPQYDPPSRRRSCWRRSARTSSACRRHGRRLSAARRTRGYRRPRFASRASSRSSRSIASRNGSVTSGDKASRTESFGP